MSHRRTLPLLIALIALAAFAGPRELVAKSPARHVILITLDGFAAYNLDDPRAALPNLRRLAREGVRAEAMTVSNPSVTWPNHTTLVTGVTPSRHGVIANGIIEPGPSGRLIINPRHSKAELCKVPTVYDLAHARGMKTAEVNWPVTRDAPTLDFRFPDHPEAIRYTTPSLLTAMKDLGLLSPPSQAEFSEAGSVRRDEIWTGAATHLIRTEKPNLLLLHLLNTDGTQHAHGPFSNEGYTALALADRFVGDVLAAVDDAGLRKSTTVIVTADHGFIRVTKQIQPNAILKRAGLDDAYGISEGGVHYVYLPTAAQRPEIVAKAKEALREVQGIQAIYEPSEYGPLGFPTPQQSPQAPQLLVAAKDGFAFSNAFDGDDVVTPPRATGSHGYLHTYPKMDALFVATGAGLRPKRKLGRINNLDVAPTLANLLGLRMENVDGKPLEEMLR